VKQNNWETITGQKFRRGEKFRLTSFFAKVSVRHMHKYGFYSKFSNVKVFLYFLFDSLWSRGFQGCFHWFSSTICSGVMVDQRFTGHYSGHHQEKFLTCEIYDFTPCAYPQGNILNIKYPEKTDD